MAGPAPEPLLDAGHCLASADRDWLDLATAKPYQVELGYVASDADKSDAGESPVYLIEYTTPTHTAGFAFTFRVHGKAPHRTLLLESRNRFRQTDDGSQQVSLVDSPLGGIGTQDEVVAAIKQIGFHTWSVPVTDLRNHATSVHCETAEGVM